VQRIDVLVVLLEWTVGRTRLRLDYFWILTFAAWAQNELLWQVLLFSVLHECGHLAALCALGLQPRQLRLSFYGMALRYDRVPDRRRETVVLFGGPAVNLILWVLLRDPANGALFLLNMLPIFPLDGGRLAALWLPHRLTVVLNALALAALTGLGGYVLYRGGGVSLLGISLYLMLSNLRSV
jgi:Zn-dependent protease